MKAIRLAAPFAARSSDSLATLPNESATALDALSVDGVEISAEMVLLPIKPSRAMFEKVAIPADAEIAAVPESVAPVAAMRTV